MFIDGICVLAAQKEVLTGTSDSNGLIKLSEIENKWVEPDYKNYIPAAQLRRMSRMIKTGLTASQLSLQEADIKIPDAIITATGLGCIEDTEKFLSAIVDNDEQMLPPTAFIQSTHNTVGGQIALLMGCHAYNFTYVHRALSLESALIDAQMLLKEDSRKKILVGGIDELTSESTKILQALKVYKKNNASNIGTLAGEGASFFVVSEIKKSSSIAKLTSVKTLLGIHSSADVRELLEASLQEASWPVESISLIITGKSDRRFDSYTDEVLTKMNAITKLNFKDYCGEYHTASGFALWMACAYIKYNKMERVLIYTNFAGQDHSIMLVEKC